MWSILFVGVTETCEELIAELWERGTRGLIHEEIGLRAFFEDEIEKKHVALLARQGVQTSVRDESHEPVVCAEDDWDPISVGERFYVMSSAHGGTVPGGRWPLKIGRSIAFGTGRHETTQLCLRAMERCLKPGQSVADVGCGSGILSMAAALLGAAQVWSCDIDMEAVDGARTALKTPVFAGSADAIADRSVDVVLANISARIVDRLALDLRRIVKENGIVIVSGFIERNPPQLIRPMESLKSDEWLCWICTPEGIKTSSDHPSLGGGLQHDPQWWI